LFSAVTKVQSSGAFCMGKRIIRHHERSTRRKLLRDRPFTAIVAGSPGFTNGDLWIGTD